MRKLIATLDNGNPRNDFFAERQSLYLCDSDKFYGYKLVIERGNLFDCSQSGWHGYGKATVVLYADEAERVKTMLNAGEFVDYDRACNHFTGDYLKNTLEVFGRQARVR